MRPTLQEQLTAYAARRLGRGITEVTEPTFVYREWHDSSRPKDLQRCRECIGWTAYRPDGSRVAFSVGEMHTPAEFA